MIKLNRVLKGFAALVVTMSIGQSFAQAESFDGGSNSGGTFVEYASMPTLKFVIQTLARDIRALPAEKLKHIGAPAEWTPKRIAGVIERLQFNTSPDSLRVGGGGSLKILDFDRKKQTITALAGFFLYYGQILEQPSPNKEMVLQLENKLIHEVSHLWGTNDKQAAEFASFAQFWITRNTIGCNFVNPSSRPGQARAFVYSVSDRYAYFKDSKIGMDIDDDGFPRIPSDFGIASTMDLEITPQKLLLKSYVSRNVSRVVVEVDRNVDSEGRSLGVYTNQDGTTEPLDCVTSTAAPPDED